ncbi:NACHT domain-containing protein [Chryseobacterium rhizosphaerae]|uniref:NACHT domain-containing protein n=1 Tax=Chryseobacterium rhizosphaerae TaxID=395937 RepID=A0ABX9IRB2_9FLAO|nr:hypothetical protein [Chryseobacterium rhizosphaerae]REC78971.1 hypothetical protein DRF57_01460 [Chryseobacterium rhizosphaerae]GEN68060.1 hypothetical protein CRH01_26280 [Chryseobacterium rhizosphaerae]
MNEKLIIESSKLLLAKISKYIEPKFKQLTDNKILEYIVETATNFSTVRTILHKDSVELSEIYFPLDFTFKNTIINDFSSFIESRNKVSIVATGGAGKTTFIKHFYIQCVVENYKIPIIFNFRDFNNFEIKKTVKDKKIIENYVFIAFTDHLIFNKIGFDDKTIEKMFESGEFVFFLDGYDELDINKKSIITKDFMDFVSRFNKNKFIISTRPYTAATQLDGFDNIYLNGLGNLKQIELFIQKQLIGNSDFANEIIKTLQNKNSLKYIELLSNPLFLILFINSFESYPKIPPKKTQFYWQVFDALFEKHETFSKRGYRRPKLSKLDRENFEFILSSFCLASYFQNLFSFTEFEFENILREVSKNIDKKFNSAHFLEDLKVSISILVEDGNILSFIHRSIQEYFVARHLSNLSESDKNNFLKILAEKQNEKNGQHTFLIELISELYSYEFKKYYIKHHITEFYKNKNYYLRDHKILRDYEKVYLDFENFKLILTYSNDFKKPFEEFIKNKQFSNININLLIAARTKKQTKIAQEILILYENKKDFFLLIDDFINKLDNSNKPLIEFAFKKR